MQTEKNITTVPVNKTNWQDFESLFQTKGILRNCWCMAWRLTREELQHNNPASRKAFIKQRIESDIPVGLLAYADNNPAAWCSIAPRETYQRLGGVEGLENVWSIACFYVKNEYRRQHITIRLINEAIKYAKHNGAEYVEAYPVDPDSPSYRHMGFKSTFERMGFEFKQMAGTRRHVMILKL